VPGRTLTWDRWSGLAAPRASPRQEKSDYNFSLLHLVKDLEKQVPGLHDSGFGPQLKFFPLIPLPL
jgi:hypothetical protein